MATVQDDNRFSPITPDDHAGSVWIAAILCLVYSVITLSLRGHLRWKMYGTDDYLVVAATVFQLGEVAAVLVGLEHGLGQTEDLLRQGELARASRAAFAGQLLYIMSLAASKGSTLFLMLRLFNLSGPKAQNMTRSKVLYWVGISILAGMGIWGLLSIIAVSVDCSPAAFIQGNAQCPRQFLRWQLITAFDVLTECILVLLSVAIVLPVQIGWALKCQVVFAFAFRLPVAALSILHLNFVSDFTTSANPGLALVPVLVLQQVQVCWSLISATVPNLKAFVKSFSSGFGIQLDPAVAQAYGSSRSNRSNAYELGSVTGKTISKSRSGNKSYNDVERHGAVPQHMNGRDKSREQDSIDSVGSQEQIIRKDMQWDITYEMQPDRP